MLDYTCEKCGEINYDINPCPCQDNYDDIDDDGGALQESWGEKETD